MSKEVGFFQVYKRQLSFLIISLFIFASVVADFQISTAQDRAKATTLFKLIKSKTAIKRAIGKSKKAKSASLVEIKDIKSKLFGTNSLGFTLDGNKIVFKPKIENLFFVSDTEQKGTVTGELINTKGSGVIGDISFKLSDDNSRLLSAKIALSDGATFQLSPAAGGSQNYYVLERQSGDTAPTVNGLSLVTLNNGPITSALRSAGGSQVVSAADVQRSVISSLGGTFLQSISDDVAIAQLDTQKATALKSDLASISPVHLGRLAATIPNDPVFKDNWNLHNTLNQPGSSAIDVDIDAPEAWDYERGSKDVIVAVIDSGVAYSNPDLAANMWINPDEAGGFEDEDDDNNRFIDDIRGWDFSVCKQWNFSAGGCDANQVRAEDNDPQDEQGHGTHVAGIIGAVGNNANGSAGINWNITMLPVKVGSTNGYLSDAEFIRAMQYVIDLKRRRKINIPVINASFGFERTCTDPVKAVLVKAQAAGILVVTAAGNAGLELKNKTHFMPAECDGESYEGTTINNVIAVTGVNRNGALFNDGNLKANYSKKAVHIGAPGYRIKSAGISGAVSLTGTSVASAHVAGVAALLFSADNSLTPERVKSLILNNSKKPTICSNPNSGPNLCNGTVAGNLGGGLLSASKALRALGVIPEPPQPTEVPRPPTPTQSPTATPYASEIGSYSVFVTSGNILANFGGIANADTFCQDQARAAGLQRNYRAILSDSVWNARDRIGQLNGPIYTTGRTLVANSSTDLWDGSIANPITYDEYGRVVNQSTVWTGTKIDGTKDDSYAYNNIYSFWCDDWKSEYGVVRTGYSNRTNKEWIAYNWDKYTYPYITSTCDTLNGISLYCIGSDTSFPPTVVTPSPTLTPTKTPTPTRTVPAGDRAPTISFTQLRSGAVLAGTVPIEFTASDDKAGIEVSIYVNNLQLAVIAPAQGTTSFTHAHNIRSLDYPNGNYTFRAVIEDSSGQTAQVSVSVTIFNDPNNPVPTATYTPTITPTATATSTAVRFVAEPQDRDIPNTSGGGAISFTTRCAYAGGLGNSNKFMGYGKRVDGGAYWLWEYSRSGVTDYEFTISAMPGSVVEIQCKVYESGSSTVHAVSRIGTVRLLSAAPTAVATATNTSVAPTATPIRTPSITPTPTRTPTSAPGGANWHNYVNPADVNGDNYVSGLDFILIQNHWLRYGDPSVPKEAAPPYLDVNGDGLISSADGLLVIDYMNNPPTAPIVTSINIVGNTVTANYVPSIPVRILSVNNNGAQVYGNTISQTGASISLPAGLTKGMQVTLCRNEDYGACSSAITLQ